MSDHHAFQKAAPPRPALMVGDMDACCAAYAKLRTRASELEACNAGSPLLHCKFVLYSYCNAVRRAGTLCLRSRWHQNHPIQSKININHQLINNQT